MHNEIEIQAPPEVVWDILIRAECWPEWYPGATGVKVIYPPGGRLEGGSVFTWNTMDLDLESRVGEFKPPARLAWETRKESIRGYHTWLLVPTGAGCRVVTDEAQQGRLAFAQKVFLTKKLHDLHAVWLRELKRRAEAAAAGGEGK